MKNVYAAFLFVLATGLHGQFSYHHAFSMGNTTYDSGQDIAVDLDGNIYVVGTFSAWFDADPGPLTTVLTPVDNDIFLAKYNDAGAFQWAFGVGGTGYDAGYGVEVFNGIVYVTGAYTSADIDLDPGPGTTPLPFPNASDVFVARYDVNGSFISALGIGGNQEDVGTDIVVDFGGFIICGNFQSTNMDADPGPDTDLLANAGGVDAFLIKFDDAGTLLYGHAFGGGGTLDSDRALGLHVSMTGDLFVTGSFSSTGGDFDPGPGTVTLNSAGSIDIFISKFNGAGALQWAQRIGDTGGDLGYGLATTSGGQVVLCGYANSDTIDLDPGPNVHEFSSGDGQDIVAVMLDTGGEYLWGMRIGGGSSDIAFAALVDDLGHLFLAGNFGDADVDFDPGTGSAPLSSSSAFETDIFLAQFDYSGTFVNAFDIGNSGLDAVWNMAWAYGDRIWVTGNTIGAVDADPGPGVALVDSLGGADVFVGAYDHVHPVGLQELEEQQFALRPNPARDRVTVDMEMPGPATLELLDAKGRTLLVQQVSSFPIDLDLRKVPAGIHTLKLHSGGGQYTRKLLRLP